MPENKKDSIIHWLGIGAKVAGNVASKVIGIDSSTIEGTIAGGALGALVTETLQNIGKDMRNRYLSKKEETRIGTSFFYLLEKFKENIDNGQKVRDDNFFDKQEGDFSRNEEILEGLLLIAQKSYEEKKVRFISYFYANILFSKQINTYHANYYLKMAEGMTYRQFCLLAIYFEKEKYGLQVDIQPPDSAIDHYDIRAEMLSLNDKAHLIVDLGVTGGNVKSQPFSPVIVVITEYGKLFYELFNLSQIPFEDKLEVAEQIIQPEWFEKLKREQHL
ncbi:MAG: hypothetical protein Q7W13_02830 [Bacteroidia bacterium]|nr:hypothetical protein [Bacteroidia bacterium]